MVEDGWRSDPIGHVMECYGNLPESLTPRTTSEILYASRVIFLKRTFSDGTRHLVVQMWYVLAVYTVIYLSNIFPRFCAAIEATACHNGFVAVFDEIR